jgi:hypothetical protein
MQTGLLFLGASAGTLVAYNDKWDIKKKIN